MILEKTKDLFQTSRGFRWMLGISVIILLAFYLLIFFTQGVHYDETFLRKKAISAEIHYTGVNQWGTIDIAVKKQGDVNSSIAVAYNLPNNINKQFTIVFTREDNTFGKGVKISDEKGNLLFEGYYRKSAISLFSKSGEPFLGDNISVYVSNQNPYNETYQIPLGGVVSLAAFDNDTFRGDMKLLILAMLLTILTAIDIKFPLFFFRMKHIWDVKDPEPSDFYVTMQHITWYIYPGIILILMIAAIL